MIFLTNWPNTQIFLMLAQSFYAIYKLIQIKPFFSKATNYLEIFNEACIAICIYHMIIFSEVYDDIEVK